MTNAFKIIPIQVIQIGAIVISMVLFPHTGRSIAFTTSFKSCGIERVYLSSILGAEGDVAWSCKGLFALFTCWSKPEAREARAIGMDSRTILKCHDNFVV